MRVRRPRMIFNSIDCAKIGSRLGSSENTPATAIQAAGPDCQHLFEYAAFQPQPEEFPAHAKIRHCRFGIAGRKDCDVLESIVLVGAGDSAAAVQCQPPDCGVARIAGQEKCHRRGRRRSGKSCTKSRAGFLLAISARHPPFDDVRGLHRVEKRSPHSMQPRELDVRCEVVIEIEGVLAGSAEIIDDDPVFRREIQEAAAMDHSLRHPTVPIVLAFYVLDSRRSEVARRPRGDLCSSSEKFLPVRPDPGRRW